MIKCRQQSTTTFPVQFKLYSSTDHILAVTGATPAVSISKNGAAFAAASGAVSELSSGWYSWAGNATDRNTLGELAIRITAAGADPYEDRYSIVPFNPFDANLGLTNLDAAVSSRLAAASISLASGAVTVGTNNDKTGYGLAANAVDSGQLTQAAADKVWSSAARTLTAFSFTVDILQSAADKVWTSTTRTLSAFSTALAVSVWDVLTANIGTTASIGLKLVNWTLGSDNRALISADVHTGGVTVAGVTADVGITQAGADKVWGSTTRTLSAFGFAVTLAGSAVQAIWDALTAALTTPASIGKLLVDNLNATIGSRLATAGYTAPPSAAAISTQVWTEPIPGSFAAGTAGNLAGNRLDTNVGSRSSHAPADVWAAATRTLSAFGFNVTVGTNNDKTGYTLATAPPTAAQVAAQIIATTLAELPQASFPATPTVGQALMLPVHMLGRGGTFNKNSGISTVLDSTGAVVMKRTDTDDGTIFSEGALVAGP